jgi:hypothetical protein
MPEDLNPDLSPFVLVKTGNAIFWDEMPWNLVDECKRLVEISYLNLKIIIFCPENGGNRFLPDIVILGIYQTT